MMSRKMLLSFLGPVVLSLLFLPGSSPAQDDQVVAKIGGAKIHMSDIDRIIGYQEPDRRKALEQNPQMKATMLKRTVEGRVISALAREKGFDKRPDIKEQMELFLNDYLTAEYVKKEVLDKVSVTEDDMKLYYKTHQDEFKTPEMVRASHILIRVDRSAPAEEKDKAKEKIEGILKRIKAGEDFGKLASQMSEDAVSRIKGGDLGFFQKGKALPEFEKVAFSLKPGDVSGLVETKLGYHIIKVEEKKEPVLEPYEKVKEMVKERALAAFKKARLEEFVDKAMKDAGVDINTDLFFAKKQDKSGPVK
ncbi:MAG: peptidylprolyl isomerase [Nitrospiraceae bacterium]|nr:peptidylprolyl isomerase [Nitrospiraceae bacterium]